MVADADVEDEDDEDGGKEGRDSDEHDPSAHQATLLLLLLLLLLRRRLLLGTLVQGISGEVTHFVLRLQLVLGEVSGPRVFAPPLILIYIYMYIALCFFCLCFCVSFLRLLRNVLKPVGIGIRLLIVN